MGDHRAHVMIEFDFHGKVYKCDMDINWCPDSGTSGTIDRRVEEFFLNAAEDGYARYLAKIEKDGQRNREREQEESDRREYGRLKQKFEPLPAPPEEA